MQFDLEKQAANGLSHLVVVFAAEKGLHVIVSITFWRVAVQTSGHRNKYLRKLTQARVYLAFISEISGHGPRRHCFLSEGHDGAEELILFRNKE